MDEFFGEDSNHLFDNYIPNLSESSIPLQQTPIEVGDDLRSGYLESVVAKATAFPTKKAKAVDEFCGGERRGSVTVVDWSDFSPGPMREAAPTLTDPGAAMNLSPEVRHRSAPTTADQERAQNRKKIKKAQYEKRRRAKIGDRLKSLHHTLAPDSTKMEKITMLKETGEKYEEVEKEAEMTKRSGDDDELSIGQQLELYVVASDELCKGKSSPSFLHPSVFLQPPFSSSPPTQNKISICSALSAAVLARPEKMEVYSQMAAYLHQFQQNRAGPSTTNQNN